jgi:hypothetical protein
VKPPRGVSCATRILSVCVNYLVLAFGLCFTCLASLLPLAVELCFHFIASVGLVLFSFAVEWGFAFLFRTVIVFLALIFPGADDRVGTHLALPFSAWIDDGGRHRMWSPSRLTCSLSSRPLDSGCGCWCGWQALEEAEEHWDPVAWGFAFLFNSLLLPLACIFPDCVGAQRAVPFVA